MFVPVGKAARDSLQVSDSAYSENSPPVSASSETCYAPIGQDSGVASGSDSAFPPTKYDIPEAALPRAIPLEGVTVPGYDILEELGRGGMGVVYKARHRRLQRLVALKMVLAGAHVGQVGLARFRAEAEAVAKLLHPNIVQIYETGEHEGRPFFSLEFVEGGSLDQQIAKSPTSPRGAAQLVETLARTMEVAHQRGIVHRDLKPANILLAKLDSQSSMHRTRDSDSSSLPEDHWSRTTVPKIADFGLAKRTDDDSSQTQSGAILGTPSYMAPEQAGGKTREIGPAADIYALGAILYELLVGRPPFKAGNPIDTVRQVIEQEPVPPRQLEPRVPYDLETICLKCLEKDPARRFPTAAELADDLRRFIDGDPIHARPTPAWERAWKWGRRRPAIVALIGAHPAGGHEHRAVCALAQRLVARPARTWPWRKNARARKAEHDARVENHRVAGSPGGAEAVRQCPRRRGRQRLVERTARPGEGIDDPGRRAVVCKAEGAGPVAFETGRARAARRGRPPGVGRRASSSSSPAATRPSSSARCTPAWIWPPTWKRLARRSTRRWPSMASLCPRTLDPGSTPT